MFRNLIDLITGDQMVIKFSENQYVYPIYKNGSSSLNRYLARNNLTKLINNQIKNLYNITVYLRDPVDRFVSGVNTYFNLKKKTPDQNTLKMIESGQLVNKHFAPQYIFLLGLHRFYNGKVNLRHVNELRDLIPDRDGPWTKDLNAWIPLSSKRRDLFMSLVLQNDIYTRCDEIMLKKYLGKSISLTKIIADREIKDALS